MATHQASSYSSQTSMGKYMALVTHFMEGRIDIIYYNQGDIKDMLVNTYLWTTSHRARNMMNFTPTPSNISQALPFFSSTSHIRHYITPNICKYFIMKPRHSYLMYPWAMDPLGLVVLHT